MRSGRIITFLIVLLAALPALVYIHDPPARDQGVFAYIGWRLLDGDVPYASGGMEHKGPLPFLAYALSFVLFGRTILAARLLGWIALLAAGWGVAVLAGRLCPGSPGRKNLAGTLAGVAYVAISGLGGLSAWWSGAQAETFMDPFVAWAAVMLTGARGKTAGRVFAAGALVGIASLGKPTVLLPGSVLLWGSRPHRRDTAAFLAGVFSPWLVSLAAFFTAGAGAEFLDSVITANLDYGGRGLRLLPGVIRWFLSIHHTFVDLFFLLPAAAGAALLWMVSRPDRRAALLPIFWVLAAWAVVLLQGRLFGYHFQAVVAPIAVLAGIGLAASVDGLLAGTPVHRAASALALAAALWGLTGLDWNAWSGRWAYVTRKVPESTFVRSFAGGPGAADVDPSETLSASKWAESRIPENETLLVWGFEPAVNFLARRRSPTRFIYDYFLTSSAVRADRREHYWQLFWKDVTESPPDWIAVVHNDVNPLEREDSAAQLEKEPRLRDWLWANYEPEAAVGDFEFFRKNR